MITDLLPVLSVRTVRTVWSDPGLISTGLAFSLPTLLILLCHELGHWLACRRYRLPSTPPFFLPAPLGLGTFGAFIRIRARLRSKAELLDVGAAGPIAGFVALLPFLLYGVAHSHPSRISVLHADSPADLVLLLPGHNLALSMVTRLFHGQLPEGVVLDLHPFALAAWVGLLATALNLMPLGQLDGGHILYAALGAAHRRVALVLLALLALAGLYWRGWLVWCVIILLMGLRHPPLADDRQRLSPMRLTIAWLCAGLFILSFMPVPVSMVPVAE